MIAHIRLPLVAIFAAAVVASPTFVDGQLINEISQLSSDISNYNLISLGSTTFTNVPDTGGGIAVNGDLMITNNSATLVGMMAAASGPSIYATGQLTISSGQTVKVNHGYGSLPNVSGWLWSGSPSDNLTNATQGSALHFNSNTTLNPLDPANNPNWNWTSLASSLTGISSALDTTANGTLSVVSQNLVLNNNGATSGVVVFTFNGATMAGLSSINITVPSNLIYVINVTNLTGGSFLPGVNVNGGTNSGELIWNFDSKTDKNFTLASGGSFYGNILAPGLTVTSGTDLEDQVIVGSLNQSNRQLDGLGDLVAIPEVPTTATWMASMAGLFMAARVLSKRVRRDKRASA